MSIGKGKLNSVVFLDIKKAFDAVNHDILTKKLDRYRISNDEFCFFVSYLSKQTQYCRVNENISSQKLVTCGVQQGSILGLLSFILYLNYLPSTTRTSNISLYADDTFLSKEVRNDLEIRQELIPEFLKICY